MAHAKNHDYHILHPSIWPFIGALLVALLLMTMLPDVVLLLPRYFGYPG